jgi:hypothetical protein
VLSILGLEADNTDAYARGLEALAHLSSLDSARAAHFPLPESQLDIALRLARTQAASAHPQAPAALSTTVRVLGALLAIVESEAEAEAEAEDEIAADAEETETTETAKLPAKLVADLLLRSLPPLAVQATARGVPTPIPISVTVAHAPTVASTLLRAALLVTVEGNACAPAAARLVRPFLPALPDGALRRAWDPELRSASAVTSPAMSAPSAIPSTVASAAASAAVSAAISTVASPAPGAPRTDAADAMALQRALASPSSSLALTPTPAALLSVLAPGLLAALATAPAPPLGIAPVLPSGTRGSASDYAGKVYSAHEFRRERDTVSGLGIGLAGVGRKASRHVDDFTR